MSRNQYISNHAVSDLILYINNSRTHSDEQVAQIAASINEFGFTNPVLIDEDGGLIAGHGRALAAKKLGLNTVPAIRMTGLTEAQKKAYIIADNQLALNAGWDLDTLKIELETLQELDFDIELLGFDDDFIDDFIDDLLDDGPAEPAMARRVLNSRFEYVYIFSNEAKRTVGKRDFRGTLSNIIEIKSRQDKEFSKIHKATYPVEFACFFIENFTESIVLDQFGGTGTTMIAAEKLNRNCYMMELDEKYVDVIIKRWEAFTGKEAIHIDSGKTYKELSESKDTRGLS